LNVHSALGVLLEEIFFFDISKSFMQLMHPLLDHEALVGKVQVALGLEGDVKIPSPVQLEQMEPSHLKHK
jgi:hypothetical protein